MDVALTAPQDLYRPLFPGTLQLGKVDAFDAVITKTDGDFGVFANRDMSRSINRYLASSEKFAVGNRYALPDGSAAIVYRRVATATAAGTLR
jgi:hypothetical protein